MSLKDFILFVSTDLTNYIFYLIDGRIEIAFTQKKWKHDLNLSVVLNNDN